MEDKCNYVYKHTSPSGKIYIGISSGDPNKRWQNGRGYAKNHHFSSAIKKYGWDNFKHEIVIKNLTREEACEAEQILIDFYCCDLPKYGYNRTSGGEASYTVSDETKELHRKAQKEHLANHPEHVEKLREAARKMRKECWESESYREYIIPKLKEAHKEVYNRKPELRKRMGEIAKARWQIPEYRERFIYALKNRVYSEETREKKSKSSSCRPVICVEKNETHLGVVRASRAYGVPSSCISACCNGKQEMSGGFHWRYADETQEQWQERRNQFVWVKNATRGKSVVCVETGEVFQSAHAAAKHVNGAKGGTQVSILKCCRGERKTSQGFHWKYAE